MKYNITTFVIILLLITLPLYILLSNVEDEWVTTGKVNIKSTKEKFVVVEEESRINGDTGHDKLIDSERLQ